MFEWTKCEDEIEFRKILSSNGWLKKFLMCYCFDEGFIYFDEKKFLKKIGVEELGRGQGVKQQIMKHVGEKRKGMVGTPMHLQSFQYFIYIISSMRKRLREHYEILAPYLVQLDKKDLGFVVDVLTKKFKLSKMQEQVLKGSL